MRSLSKGAVALIVALGGGCSPETEFRRIQTPPEAVIVVPKGEAVVRLGKDAPQFVGAATDSFDTPSTLVATWTLDDDATEVPIEPDGTVRLDVDFASLAPGDHVARLSVVDSDGQRGEDRVEWTLLGALEPPRVTITSPADGSGVSRLEEVTFRGEATDNNSAPDELGFTWTSSIDGALDGAISGDGQSVLFLSTLSEGTHAIALDVTDVDGLVGSDEIALTVSAEPPPPVDAEVGDMVFSEIMIRPDAVEDIVGEWVELYNASSGWIDLDGYVLSDLGIDRYTIAETVLVGPGEYAVLCADVDPAGNGGVACDADYLRSEFGGDGSMAFGNNGDEVVLSRPDGTVIDQFAYPSNWSTTGVAKGLDPTRLDAANNDDASQWCDQSTVLAGAAEPGTPGLGNDPCP